MTTEDLVQFALFDHKYGSKKKLFHTHISCFDKVTFYIISVDQGASNAPHINKSCCTQCQVVPFHVKIICAKFEKNSLTPMGSTEGPKFEKMGAIILHTADIIFTIYYVVIKRYRLILVIFLGFYDSLNISTCFYNHFN